MRKYIPKYGPKISHWITEGKIHIHKTNKFAKIEISTSISVHLEIYN